MAPKEFLCPLSNKLMKNPVIWHGITCEEEAIIRNFESSSYSEDNKCKDAIIEYMQNNNICTEEKFLSAIEENNLDFIATHNFFDVYLNIYLPIFSIEPIAFNKYCKVIKPTLLLRMIADGKEEMLLLFFNSEVNFDQIIEVEEDYNDEFGAEKKLKYSLLSFIIEKKLNRLAIELILRGTTLQHPECNASALHSAAITNNIYVLNVILLKDIDINEKAPDGNTALHMAVSDGCVEATKLLISFGANLDSCNNEGETPIGHASINEQVEILELLLEKGGNPNIPNLKGKTPLMRAEKLKYQSIIALLEKHTDEGKDDVSKAELSELFCKLSSFTEPDSSNPEEKLKKVEEKDVGKNLDLDKLFFGTNYVSDEPDTDSSKSSPIVSLSTIYSWALNVQPPVLGNKSLQSTDNSSNYSASRVEVSLQAPNVRSSFFPGITSTTQNRRAESPARLSASESPTILGINEIYFAATLNDSETLKRVIEEVDINTRDKNGNTAVFLAVKLGYPDAIRLLYANGADVNLSDKEGRTPLYIAAELGAQNAISVLLELGANPEIFSTEGKKPIDVAKQNCKSLFYKPPVQQGEPTENLVVPRRNSSTPPTYPIFKNRHFTW
jgi:ankyrin repeat protein